MNEIMNAQDPSLEKDKLNEDQTANQETVNQEVEQLEDKQVEQVEQPKELVVTEVDSETAEVEETAVESETPNETKADEKAQDSQEGESAEELTTEAETEKIEINNLSKTELIELLKSLLHESLDKIREDVESIKQNFYRLSREEAETERLEFLNEGGDENEFESSEPILEVEFKELYAAYKQKRANFTAQLEKEQQDNLEKKKQIIEKIKALVNTKEDVSANVNVFRDLQQEWKEIGSVPASENTTLWRDYNLQQEAFWDLIKINNELREYDFKKNLEAKNKLIEIAEGLDEEKDVISAFRQLQKLHEEWRELGPVSRELREEIWSKFKQASTVINKKHQEYFEKVREIEKANLEKKEELCEKIENFDTSGLSSYADWSNATKEILALQEDWRLIGFVPRKHNQTIFERYRAACDKFFSAKADFNKSVKNTLSDNLSKKIELCEKAEAMKESTDWRRTTQEFVKIQKEWKTIGPVQKKHSDDIWKRFISACDYFFDQKSKNDSGKSEEEQKNMELKLEVIDKIAKFEKTENTSESLAALRSLAAEWNAIGHVPFKDKDKLYKKYRTALDEQFDKLNVDVSQRRLESFKSNISEMKGRTDNRIYRERDKLKRAYDHLITEIATYENNMGFLSISSKKGSGVLQEMERKIEALKEEVSLIEKKINLIDSQS